MSLMATTETGRFSDGRVIVDFIAEYANLPIIPPFLQPSADYIHGANFASGGAGILSDTHQGFVIDLQTQLKNLEKVKSSLVNKLGEEKTEELISDAVYFISVGSNDYMGGYLDNPKMQELYDSEEYVLVVINNLIQAIVTLYRNGARKFAFLSLGPLGCLPALRAAKLKASGEDGCLEEASALGLAHNKALSSILQQIKGHHYLPGFTYSIPNFYYWLKDRINHSSRYGFKDTVNACCGAGPYGGVFTCGSAKGGEYKLCNNASDHIWWDSFHPTERIHNEFAKIMWDGPGACGEPNNLKDLFLNKYKRKIAETVDEQNIKWF